MCCRSRLSTVYGRVVLVDDPSAAGGPDCDSARIGADWTLEKLDQAAPVDGGDGVVVGIHGPNARRGAVDDDRARVCGAERGVLLRCSARQAPRRVWQPLHTQCLGLTSLG